MTIRTTTGRPGEGMSFSHSKRTVDFNHLMYWARAVVLRLKNGECVNVAATPGDMTSRELQLVFGLTAHQVENQLVVGTWISRDDAELQRLFDLHIYPGLMRGHDGN
jgi:hypothetical protein